MPAIHIRDVPEDLLRALKRRAKRNERSLQKELRHILQRIASTEPLPEALPPVALETSEASGEALWSREELYGDDGR